MTDNEFVAIVESGDHKALAAILQEDPSFARKRFAKSKTALHLAASAGRVECMKLLLAAGADIEALDYTKATPLICASLADRMGAVNELVAKGANVNAKQAAGRTAAMMAAYSGKTGIVTFLIASGTDITVVDNDGNTLSDMATRAGLDRSDIESLGKAVSINASQKNVEYSGAYSSPVENASLESTGATTADQTPTEKLPPHHDPGVEGLSKEQSEALSRMEALGFENLAKVSKVDRYVGRDEDVREIVTSLKKNQNVMMLGDIGTGKTAMSLQVAEKLAADGVIVLQVPSGMFRGDKYQNSTKEAFEKWLKDAFTLQGKIVLYFDEAHVLANGSKDGGLDTPMEILKEYIDDIGDKRLVLLGGTTHKLYEKHLEQDESFSKRFNNHKIGSASKEDALSMLLADSTVERLGKKGFEIGDREAYETMCKKAVNLLDLYIYNQAFPKKAFDFVVHMLKNGPSETHDGPSIEEAFGKFHQIPIEIIRGTFEEGSPFLSLEDKLNDRVLGQEEGVAKMVSEILWRTVSNDPSQAAPVSFVLMGPTGVGKTETAETLAKEMGLPIIKLKMSEYKTILDVRAILENLSDFMTRNYSGVILFDEVDRANKEALDILLNLLDKGVVGNGADEVRCGNQIVIATTNIADSATVALKKELANMGGSTSIDEDWLRASLVNGGLIGPTVMRVSKVIDYNPISPDIAMKIGKKAFSKKAAALKNKPGVDIVFESSFLEKEILEKFDESQGARGILRSVDDAFKKIVGNPLVIRTLRPGTTISVGEDSKEFVITVKDPNGDSREIRFKDNGNEDKQRLQAVFQNLHKRTAGIESRIADTAAAEDAAPSTSPTSPATP